MQRNVFITGVSSGIGLFLAKEYLNKNSKVFGISRRKPVELASQNKSKFKFQSVDLALLGDIKNNLTELFSNHDKNLDLVILNAGVLGPLGDIHSASIQDVQNTTDINLWSNKIILDYLFENQFNVRQVVAISTGASVVARRGWGAYSISKAALNMMIGLYAAELPNTHFCSLAPGIIDTNMQEQISKLPRVPGYENFERLFSLRESGQMVTPQAAAPQLVAAIESAFTQVKSGEFFQSRVV